MGLAPHRVREETVVTHQSMQALHELPRSSDRSFGIVFAVVFFLVAAYPWLAPIIIVMLLLGGLLVLVQGSVVAPFIYTLF